MDLSSRTKVSVKLFPRAIPGRENVKVVESFMVNDFQDKISLFLSLEDGCKLYVVKQNINNVNFEITIQPDIFLTTAHILTMSETFYSKKLPTASFLKKLFVLKSCKSSPSANFRRLDLKSVMLNNFVCSLANFTLFSYFFLFIKTSTHHSNTISRKVCISVF